MHRGHDALGKAGVCEGLSAVDCDPERRAEECLGSRSAEEDQDARLNGCEFRVEPGPTGSNFDAVGFIVDPAPAAGAPLEVLDGIRDVHRVPVDARGGESGIQHVAGRPHERLAGQILAIAGLLAYEHQLCVGRAFAEHGLRGIPPQVARAAVCGLACDVREIGIRHGHARSNRRRSRALRGAKPSQSLLKYA